MSGLPVPNTTFQDEITRVVSQWLQPVNDSMNFVSRLVGLNATGLFALGGGYVVNDYCIYNTLIYKCIAPIAPTVLVPSSDPTHWVPVLTRALNVDDFPGATDQAKMQAALNSGAPSISYTRNLIFTAGVTVPSNVSIQGDGTSAITWDSSTFSAFTATTQSKVSFSKVVGISVLDSDTAPFIKVLASTDIRVNECGATNGNLFFANSTGANYAAVNSGNSCYRIHVADCWVNRTRVTTGGLGAIALFYCYDSSVTGNILTGVNGGVQLWGGDANTSTGNGALANARKCRNVTVANNVVKQGTAGTWGSMMQDCSFTGNVIEDMTDVGVDFEGSFNCTATGNAIYNAVNGGLITFFYCRDNVFSGNTVRVTNANYPPFAIYNDQVDTNNKSVEVIGNVFEGDGVIPIISNGGGPCETIVFRGNMLRNCIVDFFYLNSRYTTIEDNQMIFDVAYGSAFNAVQVSGVNAYGTARIRGNVIRSQVTQPANSYALYVEGEDFNSSPVTEIDDNQFIGFPNDLHLKWNGANVGVWAMTKVRRNTFDTGNYLREETGAHVSTVIFEDNRLADTTYYPSAVPVANYWNVGNRIYNSAPTSGGFIGSVCTTAGTPGTWKTFGLIS